jgi:hypothetical protein
MAVVEAAVVGAAWLEIDVILTRDCGKKEVLA